MNTKKHNIFPLGALNKNTKEYFYPEIANKIDEYVCPDCDRDLILCKGEKNIAHFRHYTDSLHPENLCNHYNNPSESQIHKDSKLLLKKLLETKQITITRNCNDCCKPETYEIPLFDKNDSEIINEYRFKYNESYQIADVAYLCDNEILSIFEIYNTSRVEAEKRPEPWFEIKAYKLFYLVNKNLDNIELECERILKCDNCIKKYTKKTLYHSEFLRKTEKFVRKTLGQTLLLPPNLQKCLNNYPDCKCENILSGPKLFHCNGVVDDKGDIIQCVCNMWCDCKCDNCIKNIESKKNMKIQLRNSKSEEFIKYTLDHLRFNFHADEQYEIEQNKEIIELFNDSFKGYKVVIRSWKGTIWALIVSQMTYKLNNLWGNDNNIIEENINLPHIKLIVYSGEGTVDIIVNIIDIINSFDKAFYACLKCSKIVSKSDMSQENLEKKICSKCADKEQDRVYLNVPFSEKELIKKFGGKFDPLYKKWFVENKIVAFNPQIIKKWSVYNPIK
jgi:hypothetical protein